MCLAVPAKIARIDGVRAQADLRGNIIEADLSLIDDPQVGDWILVHAGFAIERLDEQEASETLALFADFGEGIGGPAGG